MKNDSAYIKQICLRLGNRIREFRKQKKYTIEDLADLADLHPTFLGQVERGEANASVSTLSKIAAALETNICNLFSFILQDSLGEKVEIRSTEKEKLINELISELIKYDSGKIKLCLEIIRLCLKF